MSFIEELLSFAAKHEVYDELHWNEDLTVAVRCNDVFWWATADAEELTADTLDIFKQAVIDSGSLCGPILYCSRQRKMRPQGAFYKCIATEYWPLLDACGPEREADTEPFGNPTAQPTPPSSPDNSPTGD